MLTKFSVSNFRSFNSEFILDLQETNNYEFNKGAVVKGVVNNALVYGHNGVGKSNLGLAIFDVICHLTDMNSSFNKINPDTYLNALDGSSTAKFEYQFKFENDTVLYKYEKPDALTVLSESLSINGNILAKIDRNISNEAEINIRGAETLNRELTNRNLSLLKYIRNNSVLNETDENRVLIKFYHFIDSMLFFRSLDTNIYLGLQAGKGGVEQGIIIRNNVKDLESFLNKAGIECKLKVVKELENDRIAFDFGEKSILFSSVASTGTKALTLFYYWRQSILEKNKVSFLFIDEFDAFYHHELSALIVEELKATGVQFILTTHNTAVLTNDLLRPDCYFLMNKQSIRSLANSTVKELREAHNIEKMYKAGSFNTFNGQ